MVSLFQLLVKLLIVFLLFTNSIHKSYSLEKYACCNDHVPLHKVMDHYCNDFKTFNNNPTTQDRANILTSYMREIVMDNEKILAETTCQKHVVANNCYQWDETIKNPGQQCVENTNQYCLHGGTKYRC